MSCTSSTLIAGQNSAVLPVNDDRSLFVGWRNIAGASTVSASSFAPGFDPENAADGVDFDSWKPDDVSGPHWLEYTAAIEQDCDYVGVRMDGVAELQRHNGSDWEFVSLVNGPTNVVPFGRVSATRWRLYSEDVFEIRMLNIGLAMCLPCQPIGWDDPRLNPKVEATPNVSEQNVFLGASIRRYGVEFTIVAENAPIAWMRSEWAQFIRHSFTGTFFFHFYHRGELDEYLCKRRGDSGGKYQASTLISDRLPVDGVYD